MNTDSATVSDLIHASIDQLSDAERRVARTLLADYPASGLGTSHALARSAGVSAPTVIRLATRLGLTGFSDMQGRLRSEVSTTATSPMLRAMAQGSGRRHSTEVGHAMHRRIEAIETTTRLIPAAEIATATELIVNCPARVLVTGGFFSSSIARILALQLSQLRRDVVFLEEPLRREVGPFLDAKKRSVLVLFDLRRYEANSLSLARRAENCGIEIILITDRWMSPIASFADIVLATEVRAVPFDTFAAVLAVAEVLVESVATQLGAKGLRRMQQWEQHAIGHALVDGAD